MTNEELISKIKAEIERRIEHHDSLASNAESEMIANLEIGAAQALDDILPFVSTLESEKLEADLEKEINSLDDAYFDLGGIAVKGATYYLTVEDLKDIARHFYELGCRRTAEKYDEIEYNRQRAEESVPKNLEEAAIITLDEAESVADEYTDFLEKGLIENQSRPIGGKWFIEYARKRFIAGAKWQAEQLLKSSPLPEDTVLFNKGVEEGKRLMMEEAVEGIITTRSMAGNIVTAHVDYRYKDGQKVRIIIVKEEN